MGRRILNDALRTIVNAEKRNMASAQFNPISTAICSFLSIMKHRGYIKDFHVENPHRVGKATVELLGRVNNCKALTYRQDLKAKEIEEYRLRTLPSQQWGYVVITTPNGVLDHEEAIKQNVGGQVLGESPSSSASDIDNLNNQMAIESIRDGYSDMDNRNHVISAGNRSNFARLLSFVITDGSSFGQSMNPPNCPCS